MWAFKAHRSYNLSSLVNSVCSWANCESAYLSLQLHHVRFYFQVGFIQFLNLIIQVLHVLIIFNTCSAESGDTRQCSWNRAMEYCHYDFTLIPTIYAPQIYWRCQGSMFVSRSVTFEGISYTGSKMCLRQNLHLTICFGLDTEKMLIL